jgi:hypothetical protein
MVCDITRAKDQTHTVVRRLSLGSGLGTCKGKSDIITCWSNAANLLRLRSTGWFNLPHFGSPSGLLRQEHVSLTKIADSSIVVLNVTIKGNKSLSIRGHPDNTFDGMTQQLLTTRNDLANAR